MLIAQALWLDLVSGCAPSSLLRSTALTIPNRSFLCWSISFYPQPLLNLRRRSTVGAALDFSAINVLGFMFYFLSTLLQYASPVIRAQYAQRHPRSPTPTVRANDVAFAAHAIVLSVLVCSMFVERIWGFRQRPGQGLSGWIAGVGAACILAVLAAVVSVLYVGDGTAQTWAWIDVVSEPRLLPGQPPPGSQRTGD